MAASTAVAMIAVLVLVASLPYWLPQVVVALRVWVFARINGPEGIAVPGEVVDASSFLDVYADPAAGGRSRGAALSDLFWYWLSPGAHVHQEHLERGPRYDEVAGCSRRILSLPTRAAQELVAGCVRDALPERTGLVRLRDLVMPVWAEFYHRLVFGRPATDEVRRLIVDNADDVITALKCCGLRHLDRRLRLTAHLERVLDEVPHALPASLDRRERAYYLQGTFFNTAVVQSSEATAHLLMRLAGDESLQRAARDGDALDRAFEETLRRYPLFGVAHRITTDQITLSTGPVIPSGSVLCFNYQEFHRAGGYIPFGVAANRPCPAWHLAPITVKALVRELLSRYTFATSASHTRTLANRGPCLMLPRPGVGPPPRNADRPSPDGVRPSPGNGVRRSATRASPLAMAVLRGRDRWEDVGRSVTQLVLGTAMVWHARRLRLCQRHFEREDQLSRAAARPDPGPPRPLDRPPARSACQDASVAYDVGLATRLRDLIGDEPGLVEKKMFGGLAMLLDGNMAVGVHGDALIVRTDADQQQRLLAEPGTRVFDLTGRPMKGWLLVDPVGCAEDDDLRRWVDRGVAYARSLPK